MFSTKTSSTIYKNYTEMIDRTSQPCQQLLSATEQIWRVGQGRQNQSSVDSTMHLLFIFLIYIRDSKKNTYDCARTGVAFPENNAGTTKVKYMRRIISSFVTMHRKLKRTSYKDMFTENNRMFSLNVNGRTTV